ncbi:Integrin beta-like protein 1, partial [Lamprotornis superbus]
SGLGIPASCRLSRAESELRCRVPGGKLCNDRGRCECGVCICQVTESGKYYGPLCECHDWVCETYDGKVCTAKQKPMFSADRSLMKSISLSLPIVLCLMQDKQKMCSGRCDIIQSPWSLGSLHMLYLILSSAYPYCHSHLKQLTFSPGSYPFLPSPIAMESVTVGSANVMKAGMAKLVSIQLLAILHGRKAMKCARILKMSSVLVQAHVIVAGANVQTQKEADWYMANFVNVMTENALMMKQERFVQAMESVTVETVTVRLVGMEINVNSSVTSPPGRSRKDAHLQMAKSAATEAHVYVGNVHAMMWTQLVTGEIFMEILVSVMKGTAKQCMIDILMTSVQVMDSVIVEDVTVKKDGLGKSVNIHIHVQCQLKKALRNAKEILIYLALEEGDVNVANALVSLQETTELMAKTVNVMIDSVKMQMAMPWYLLMWPMHLPGWMVWKVVPALKEVQHDGGGEQESLRAPATVESASVHPRNGTFRVISVNAMTETVTNMMVSFAQVMVFVAVETVSAGKDGMEMLVKSGSGENTLNEGRQRLRTFFVFL